ncbi:MAG: metallophosphoesterase [Spirochaetia bacterium]
MKILCVADHIDPRIYSCSAKERYKDIGLVLSAGDLPMRYHNFIMGCLNKPLLFIFGNHNLKYLSLFKKDPRAQQFENPEMIKRQKALGGTHIHSRLIKERGVLVAGLGGSKWYNGGVNQFTEFKMWINIIKLIPKLLLSKLINGRYLDILLTHAAPWHINDKPDPCHQGFKSFLWFMKTFKPKYLVHGHIHLYELNASREQIFHQTRVINAYDHIIIEVESEEDDDEVDN